MPETGGSFGTSQWAVLVGFHVFILAMLALDLGVFHRRAHSVSLREAGIWSALWVALALVFAAAVWRCWDAWRPGRGAEGPVKAVEFLTGYLVEKSLSVDNLFVFLVIFRYFAVPPALQHRVLVWGVLGAVVLRAVLILAGAALLNRFHWVMYAFGLFLIFSAWKLGRSTGESVDPGKNLLLRLARRYLPVVDEYHSARFWVRRAGRWHATPLPLVLLAVESTDVMFAIDSVPAVFGITQDPFIVYTSNVFAILGLRALYFLLAGFLGMFRYLKVGLALVLALVGLKMILEEPLQPYWEAAGLTRAHLVLLSLGTIAAVMGGTVVASLVVGPQGPPERPRAAEDRRAAEAEPSASDLKG
jgi:tellurite resistance protein TerC